MYATVAELRAEGITKAQASNARLENGQLRIAFTDWRMIYVDVQGILGNKKEYLTVPYRSITAFSITSAGTIDIDAEIAVFLSGHPPIEFKVGKFTNTEALQKLLAKRMNLVE